MVQKSHQKVVTRYNQDLVRSNSQIREKIHELKQELRKYTTSRIGELYSICEELVRLKSALPENIGVGKRYTFRSLEWEEDLDLSSMDIRYIQAYGFISNYGKQCVAKGLLQDTTICHFLAISSLLRETPYQDKLIDLIIERKIRISEVSELTRGELVLFLEGKLKKRKDDTYFLSSAKTLRSMLSRLKQREELLKSDNIYKTHLISSVNNLKKYLESF